MFKHTLTELSDLKASDEQWNDAVKKRYLMTAVRDNSDLQQLLKMDVLNRINSPHKKGMSYQQFYDVLMSAATHYDHKHAAKINRGSYRKINYTELTREEERYLMSEDKLDVQHSSNEYQEPTDEPIEATTYMAYKMELKNDNRPYIPPDIWKEMTPKVRKFMMDPTSWVPKRTPVSGTQATMSTRQVQFMQQDVMVGLTPGLTKPM
jgi:hypothetical protein